MKMINKYALLSLLLIVHVAIAQNWVRFFSANSTYDQLSAQCIQPTAGDGVVLCGSSRVANVNVNGTWFACLSANGETIWNRHYANPQPSMTAIATWIQPTSDGYITCGQVNNRFWVAKLSSDGSIVWERTYSSNGYANRVEPYLNGFITCGYAYIDSSYKFTVYRLAANGDSLWRCVFPESIHSSGSCTVLAIRDSLLLYAGYRFRDELYPSAAFVTRLSENGDTLWTRVISNYRSVILGALDDRNQFYLVGSRSGSNAVFRCTASGEIDSLFQIPSSITPRSLAIERSGDLLIAGDSGSRNFAGRFQTNGTLLRSYTNIYSTRHYFTNTGSIRELSNGDIAVMNNNMEYVNQQQVTTSYVSRFTSTFASPIIYSPTPHAQLQMNQRVNFNWNRVSSDIPEVLILFTRGTYRTSYLVRNTGSIDTTLPSSLFTVGQDQSGSIRVQYVYSGPSSYFSSDSVPVIYVQRTSLPFGLVENIYELNLSASPNPFNSMTTIHYSIRKGGSVELLVYNTLGQRVNSIVHKYLSPGSYTEQLNATNLPSGVYFCVLHAEGESINTKLLLMR